MTVEVICKFSLRMRPLLAECGTSSLCVSSNKIVGYSCREWIIRKRPIEWSHWLPDMTPIDFFVKGDLKIYRLEELQQRINVSSIILRILKI